MGCACTCKILKTAYRKLNTTRGTTLFVIIKYTLQRTTVNNAQCIPAVQTPILINNALPSLNEIILLLLWLLLLL